MNKETVGDRNQEFT